MDRRQIATGGVLGLVAYALGYVVVFLATTQESGVSWELLREVVGDAGIAGWAFYDVHFVGLSGESPGIFEVSVTLLGELSTDLPVVVYRLVPVVILLLAGAIAVAAALDDIGDLTEAATAGALVVVGYLPPVLAGAFLFRYEEDVLVAEVSLGPDLGAALVVMAVAYPVVLGAVGGVVVFLLRNR